MTSVSWKRYVIPDDKRGHRKKISDEPTKRMSFCLPLSMKLKCKHYGAEMVRKWIKEGIEKHETQMS